MAKDRDQATIDHNKGQEDAAHGRGYNQPYGAIKEAFFKDSVERNGNYDRGFRHVADQKK